MYVYPILMIKRRVFNAHTCSNFYVSSSMYDAKNVFYHDETVSEPLNCVLVPWTRMKCACICFPNENNIHFFFRTRIWWWPNKVTFIWMCPVSYSIKYELHACSCNVMAACDCQYISVLFMLTLNMKCDIFYQFGWSQKIPRHLRAARTIHNLYLFLFSIQFNSNWANNTTDISRTNHWQCFWRGFYVV